MSREFFQRIVHFFAGVGPVMGMVWIGLCLFSIGMLILMYTRWGQSHPLEKCMGLSVLAHLLLVGYATTISLTMHTQPTRDRIFQISLVEGDSNGGESGDAATTEGDAPKDAEEPWEAPRHNDVVQPKAAELDRAKADAPKAKRIVRGEIGKLPGEISLDKTAIPSVTAPEPKIATVEKPPLPGLPNDLPTAIEVPKAQNRETPEPAMPSLPKAELVKEPISEPAKKSEGDLPQVLLQTTVSPPRMDSTDLPTPGMKFEQDDPNAPGTRVRAAENAGGSVVEASRGTSSPSIAGIAPPYGNLKDFSPGSAGGILSGGGGLGEGGGVPDAIPEIYKLRTMPNRPAVARQHGGSTETERAVAAALKWLAENQAADGRWKAGDHGAGRDENVQGHTRQNAGSQADAGVSGLALLAFLAGGHTHEEGEYKNTVRRGLEFLIGLQARDGNLGGTASTYEFMYCHAMATCALSEAYGMTHDKHLRDPLVRAINYTLAAQDQRGGGWRYKPGDSGDTSQLGWQLMSLKSAELAGIPMPDSTRRGIVKFLQSVSSGKSGGLASYRAGEQVLHSMTAEALVCWQFLGISRNHPACNEAGDFLLGELPGQGIKPNDYYWYYGTLAMYQLQGEYWEHWNEALQKTLLERQIKDGPLAGAWDTDTVWGGYGGRIYTTAIASLSLEVYYRFLPLYESASAKEKAK